MPNWFDDGLFTDRARELGPNLRWKAIEKTAFTKRAMEKRADAVIERRRDEWGVQRTQDDLVAVAAAVVCVL